MITPMHLLKRIDGEWEEHDTYDSLGAAWAAQQVLEPPDAEPFTILMTHSMYQRWKESVIKDPLEFMKIEAVALWGSEIPTCSDE